MERGLVRRILGRHEFPVIYAFWQARRQIKLFDEIDGALDPPPLVVREEAVRHPQSKLDIIADRSKVVKEGIAPKKVVRGAILIDVRNALVGGQQR